MKLDIKTTIIGVLALACAISLGTIQVQKADLRAAKTETARVQGELDGERMLSSFTVAYANARAEASEKARLAAVEAGKANRAAATTYLTLPTPAPELRCDAAQALIEQALQGARQ